MAQITSKRRSDIDAQYKWNAESILSSPAEFEAACQPIEAKVESLAQYKGKLSSSPRFLADALDDIYSTLQQVDRLYVYASMSYSVDTADQAASAMDSKAMSLWTRSRAIVSYRHPELLAMDPATLAAWVKEEPRLAHYQHYFERLANERPHVRSIEVEEVLGLAIEPTNSGHQTMSLLTNADLKFAPAQDSHGQAVPVTQSTMTAHLLNPDRELRRTAWENYTNGYLSIKNGLANNLMSTIKRDVFYTRARFYSSALEAALAPENIPVSVFHNLIDTFRRHLPTWHRYWRIRRRALKVDQLYPYDIWAPLTSANPTVSYAQAVEWIAQGMQPLGQDYVSVLKRGCLQERWVDVCPNVGKSAGAFSSGTQGTYPFIMTSFTDDVQSLSTLAHELGHSMHSYLAWQTQPYIYADYSLFVAEVASNFNQAMVRYYLMQHNTDPEFRIVLLSEAMSNFHRYFFVMPTLARLELELHERNERGEPVTADTMINLLADFYEEGYGGEMVIDRQRVGVAALQFGHLYANFYVFQYATGISGAHALATRILQGVPGATEDYLNFLRTGGSMYPLDALKLAGVDLSTPEAVEQTFKVLEGYIDELEQLTQ